LGRVEADGWRDRVFMEMDNKGIWIAHREAAVPPQGNTWQSLWDLVDRPQEARGGSVLVPPKANNRFAGFCLIKSL